MTDQTINSGTLNESLKDISNNNEKVGGDRVTLTDATAAVKPSAGDPI